MDFSFSDEQRMLADTAAAFLAEVSDSPAVRAAMATPEGYHKAVWQRLCNEMYWQGILVPEALGGLELSMVDMVIALEKAGERLHASPLFTSAVAALALRTSPPGERRNALLGAILEGKVIALAHTDARPNWISADTAVRAERTRQGFVLSGEARFIPFGHAATTLLVVARLGDAHALFAVEATLPGVKVTRTPTMDQTRAMAAMELSEVSLIPVDCLSEDFDTRASVIDMARIMVAADQVGCAQSSLDISVAYVKERVQFGRSIASFQAIKHKAADMMLKVESSRSLLYYAACVVDEWLAGESSSNVLAEAAAMAGACASEAAFFCAGTGIQLHGGVGITEEYDIQLYFKRARATENYLGSPADLREAVAAQLLDGDV